MDENKEEIQKLRKQVRNLRIAFLLTQIGFLIISIIFQIQYCRMMHYYREIFQLNQEISQSLIDVNSVLQLLSLKIAGILIHQRKMYLCYVINHKEVGSESGEVHFEFHQVEFVGFQIQQGFGWIDIRRLMCSK